MLPWIVEVGLSPWHAWLPVSHVLTGYSAFWPLPDSAILSFQPSVSMSPMLSAPWSCNPLRSVIAIRDLWTVVTSDPQRKGCWFWEGGNALRSQCLRVRLLVGSGAICDHRAQIVFFLQKFLAIHTLRGVIGSDLRSAVHWAPLWTSSLLNAVDDSLQLLPSHYREKRCLY